MPLRRLGLAEEYSRHADIRVRVRQIRIELQRQLEFGNAALRPIAPSQTVPIA
jgi:hypothetical protein